MTCAEILALLTETLPSLATFMYKRVVTPDRTAAGDTTCRASDGGRAARTSKASGNTTGEPAKFDDAGNPTPVYLRATATAVTGASWAAATFISGLLAQASGAMRSRT